MVLLLIITKPSILMDHYAKFQDIWPRNNFLKVKIFLHKSAQIMTSYIDDVNKRRLHGNIVLFSKDIEYVNTQSGKVSLQLIKKYKLYNKKNLLFYF